MASVNDPRKEYIVQCIISALNIPRNDFRSNTASNAALEKFLDDPNEKVLQAVENAAADGGKRTVTLASGLSNMTEGCTEMHFQKVSDEPLTEANIKTNVTMSSLRKPQAPSRAPAPAPVSYQNHSPATLNHDPRNEYILQCVCSVLSIPRNALQLAQNSDKNLSKFLDDPNEKVIQAIEVQGVEGYRTVNLTCNFDTYIDGCNEVHFVKLSYTPLTQENLPRDVLVSSLRMSSARSLFYNIRDVYLPLLVQSSGKAEALEGRLADCLVEMEAGLSASLRRGLVQRTQFDEADLSGIISPIDEVRFWSEYKNASGVSSAATERASKFADILTPITSELEDMNKKSFPQLMDAMDTICDAVDNLWQTEVEPNYPKARMEHFLRLVAGALGRSVQSKLNSLNIWTSAFSQVSKHIREGNKVCEKWNEITVDLTGVQWRSTENRWEGEQYKDTYLASMAARISEVSQLRSQHDQILKLLPEDELKALQIEGCFEPFTKLAAFSYNDYTVPMWKSALSEYEMRMAPIESRVAERLRIELFTNTSNPAQTVRVFQRYQDLLERKNIRDSLTNERERLLTELGVFVERILHELDTFLTANLPGGRGLSIHARKMMWVEHLRSKADLAARPLTGFLKDLPNVSKLSSSIKRVRNDLKEYRTRTFKEWQDEIESQLNDPDDPIALEMNSRVMDFDTAQQGALKITYSERLILLVKEARLFEQMGCTIPSKVKQAVQNGMKFYRFAVQLKQICNFYNNLSAELLPSQKFMVLQPALAFEQLFSDKQSGMKKVQWAKLDQLETFTRNVKEGAERLRSVNRRLRNGHAQVTSEVVQLATVSLLRQRDLWKQKLAQIQKSIDQTIQACGCEQSDAKNWKAHWDYQIFKIMEVQYRFGLESLNENLPEMKADLVLANKQLRLKPPLEELKTAYYKEIKSFIALPLSFKGVDGAAHIYRVMPDRNQQGIGVVFQKAEQLFSNVHKLQESFTPWLVVGLQPERMQEMVEALQDPKEWDLNFKSLKAKRKDMDKIPDSIKIDCLTVSTVVLKSVIEEHLERLSDALVLSLKRKVIDEVKMVQAFLVEALDKLNVRPDSVAELGKAQADSKDLMDRQGEYAKLMASADEKNKMLKGVAGGVDTSEVHNKFEEFHIRLDAFEALATELREELRGKMDQRIGNMASEIQKFASKWQSLKPKAAEKCSIDEAKKNAQEMQGWLTEWEALKEQIDTLTSDCADFGLDAPAIPDLATVEEDLNQQQQSWSLFEQYTTQIEDLMNQTWLEFRPHLFKIQDLASEWLTKLKDVRRDHVTHLLAQNVQRLGDAYPVMRSMSGEPFERDHWKILFTLLKLPNDMRLETFYFRHVVEKLDLVMEKADDLKELTSRAVGEVTIRDAVMEVGTWFEQTEFSFMDHAVKGGIVPLIKDWKDMMSSVSDMQALCSSLKDSRYFAPFKDQVDKFEEKLALLDELLIIMNKVQRKWVYLEPIFGRGSMPREKERFDKVNLQYRQIMKNVGNAKKVNYLCTIKGLKDQFATLADQLERCQKALNEFLEEKRHAFPRLYFIGDEDLLEILGQSSNPEVIQTHLKKLFAGIAIVEFGENVSSITKMLSSLHEEVPLSKPVVVKDGEEPRNVEQWLSELSQEMVVTLTQNVQNCYRQPEMDRNQFEQYPSQILCLSANIHFTQNVEKNIQSGQLVHLKNDLQQQLSSLTSQQLGDALSQAKLKALILDLIHNVSVIDDLLSNKVQRVGEWNWFRQLKYYLKPGCAADQRPCYVKMLECELQYSFEYQGNASKLVHTPLTDTCYLTLMHGMHLGYGGNPYGPAGTGKTESVKALGACLGRQVLVFNCDEGIDFQAMGRIFIGLVRCGAWGCFDEFNRLLEEQMSAISQSVQVIQAAIKNKASTVNLMSKEISVNHNAGIFITLNPATKGYGGRQKLPDNLKQLFRPVAMSVPDNELIAEVMMYSEGFMSAKILAQKVVALFLLSRQLLSAQQHYDWGLRALKPILTLAGRLLQEAKVERTNSGDSRLSEEEEAIILLKAVRMNTLSKLTFADSRRFQELCVDLFPGINVKDIEYKELEQVIRETLKEMKLNEIDAQISKMLQFHEACQQRMGVGIVGPSGCGKSTIWKVLDAAYKKQQKKYVVHVMNPKSMSRVRLLGYMDHDTREWFDGVLTASARKVIKEPVTTHNWVICDGDIDPEWVESLNSVLDDNRLLTMPNGERIQFGTNVNFIFETDNLRFASPATISRLTMIFLSEEDVDVRPMIVSWICKQPEELHAKLEQWFDEIFYKALDWVYKDSKPLELETTRMGMVRNVLGHMVCQKPAMLQGMEETSQTITKADFILAVCRGLGGNLTEEDRTELAREVFKWANDSLPDPTRPLNCQAYEGTFTRYEPGSSLDSQITFEALTNAGSLCPLVPTVSVLRDMDLFRNWLLDEQPMIVCGPAGCGKSLLIFHAIRRLQHETDISLSIATLHCNAQTSSKDVLRKLRQFCSVTSGNTGRSYRPREGRRLVLFLKDVNLPVPDKYDTSEIVMFLEQIVMHNGFYDDDLEFVQLMNIQIICSVAPASTLGRHMLATRLTANVRVCAIPYPTMDELQEIYTQIVNAALANPNFQNVAERAHHLSGKVAEAMVEVYSNVRSKYTVDDHEHYVFSPRDLTRWTLNLLRYEAHSVEAFLEAWAYEASRIFRDRLVGVDAQAHFDNILKNAMAQSFNVDFDTEALCFTSLTNFGDEGVPAGILTKVSREDYKKLVIQGKVSYEREVKDLPIELFSEVMDQLSWIDRALSGSLGNNILLVGRSGVGRRSLNALMCHLQRLQIISPAPSKKYEDKEWKRDLKQAMQMAGIEKQHTIFFLEDHHLRKPEFLESINSLLSAGDVPGLWTPEEMEPLLAPIKEEFAASQGRGSGARTPFDYFVSQVRMRLRIVLSMDGSHPHFLPYCAANPALFNCCTVMWLEEWSEQSKAFIAQQQLGDIVADKHKNLAPLLIYIHETQVAAGASTRHYITLLKTCDTIYKSKIATSSGQSAHLEKGLYKLEEVSVTVQQLQVEAAEKQKVLEEKQKLAAEALTRITAAMQQAAERRQETEQLEVSAQREQESNAQEKQNIERELNEIQPILEAAKKAVGSIKSDHLNEIRALKMPPEPIHDVLNGVLRLMGNNDNSWSSMKKFLTGSGAIARIMNFDPRSITPEVRADVEKLLKEKANSFDHATIYRVSVAAAPLAKWVHACVRYSAVLVKVAPMEAKLDKATENLQVVQKRLEECRAQLEEIDKNVAQLRADFEARTSEAQMLRIDLERANATLEKANNLMSKMSGEKVRWQQQVKEIKREAEMLSTYTCLAAAYCTYLGHSPEDVRQKAINMWTGKRGIEGFDFLKIMSSESELLTWKSQGLSADRLSQENAVMIKSGIMAPFIVDPNSQAIEWLKNYMPSSETVLQQDPKLMSQLEMSVRFGKCLIVQEVDGIEAFLFTLLRKDLTRQGPRMTVQIGEKMSDYNEGFSLFLCTRNSNAIDQLPPNAACLVTRVNFSVTRAGLEGQLLGTILQQEKPELEQRKSELLQREEEFKVQLADLEKKLLESLADASGNILENEPLIQTLEQTKAAATTISDSLAESSKLQVDLDQQREVYRPLATLGSRIFILIRELFHMDHMYRFSLESFTSLFTKVLNLQLGCDTVEEKLRQFGNQLKIMVLFYISRSLFKQDRLALGLHLVRGIMPEKFEPNEWELFQGAYIPPAESGSHPPAWCPPDRQSALQLLRSAFPRIDETWQLAKDALWSPWVASDKCEEAFDSSVYSRMSSFQRVLLIQAVRPDRLESALTQFACEAIGVASLSPPPRSLQHLHSEETESKTPILFVTTPGADPSIELEDFAKAYSAEHNPAMSFHQLAMGGGQNDDAIRLLRDAAKAGDWVCLKNLHLVISWVPLLEKEIKSLQPHPNFRCWLTTEPHARFPPIILETSLKVTYEAPPGVKKNLLRTLESWNQTWFASGNELRSQVIFVCAHFHAIMQERRTYIPQGWTKFYEFSQSDLQSACETVSMLVNMSASTGVNSAMDWTTLIGVMEQAVYGCRVDNPYDQRLAREYLSLFFRGDVLDGPRRKAGSSLEIPPFEIPASTNIPDFRAKVEALPDLDNPQSFGMAANADRSLQRINSTRVISTVRQLAAGSVDDSAGSSGVDVKAWKEQLGPLFKLWDNVNRAQLSKLSQVQVRAVSVDDSPVVAFVLMDAAEATKLGNLVSASLNNINKVVNGTGLSTPEIISQAMSLLRGEAPMKWLSSWPSAPENPSAYLQALAKRISALKGDWINRVKNPNAIFQQPVVLSDFLRPDVFLNALRQQSARALRAPIDSLHLVASFEPQLLADPSSSPLPVTIQDLILEGCSFDVAKKMLIESARNASLASVLPPVTIAWMARDSHPERAISAIAGGKTAVGMPIYASLSREKLIGEIYLHTDSARQRILNAAALFLTEND